MQNAAIKKKVAMINSEYMKMELAEKPQQANESCLGFVIPLAGAANHAYLWRLYQGLAPLRRKLITKWCMPGGWVSSDDSDILLLSKKNIMWKGANKCWRGGCNTVGKIAGHSVEVPQPPLGWRRRLHHFIDKFDMSALMITYGGFGVSLLPELERTDVPVSMVFGGSDAQISENNPWYADRLRRLWDRVDQCIFISRFLKDQAVERGCPRHKCKVIYRGCMIKKVSEREEKRYVRIISVGDLGSVKGYEYLIRAFALTCRQYRKVRLSIIGRGVLKNELKRLAFSVGVADKIDFMGSMPWEQVQYELSQSDIYVQPSVRTADGFEEGFCQAVLEGQVMQLPAVVFNSGGLVETIKDEATGFIVAQRDCRAMSDAINTLIADPDLRKQMGLNGRRRAIEQFDIDKLNAIWRNTAQELMGLTAS
jgi:colanic acid/amylovoran biosynthesis glycosyltransferase